MSLPRPAVRAAAAVILLAVAGCSGSRAGTPAPRPSSAVPSGPQTPSVAPTTPSPTPIPPQARALHGADGSGTAPTAAAVAAALAGPLALAGLGPSGHTHAYVVDAATGQALLDQDGAAATPPASTLKLATAAAALTDLGPTTRLTTTVVGPAPVKGVVHGDLYLVGAGDQTLTTATSGLKGRVSIAALAETVKAAGVTSVTGRVYGDGLLFTGGTTAPGWHATYISEGSVAPVTALEVDMGKYAPNPEPAARVADPAATAAVDLTAALRAQHVVVAGEGASATKAHPATDAVLAALQGPTVSQLVQQMLTYSDNDLAESLGRLVSLHEGGAGDAAGAAAAVKSVDAAAGFDLGDAKLSDTSGLSVDDRISPVPLVAILRASVSAGYPDLRAISQGLPVAGRTGTLADRYQTAPASAAKDKVHAKTGALLGISTEDGWVVDRSGRMLVFALGSDDTAGRPQAESALDQAAAALEALT